MQVGIAKELELNIQQQLATLHALQTLPFQEVIFDYTTCLTHNRELEVCRLLLLLSACGPKCTVLHCTATQYCKAFVVVSSDVSCQWISALDQAPSWPKVAILGHHTSITWHCHLTVTDHIVVRSYP